ncbi:DUF1002 domain-containing protein [Facklamia sp. P12955]|uniref:DUF1002 domain-containing protein n=1 Tax=Facklamia sp. P12955 TaxID=3421946 RepID=UPI003D17DDA9
MKKIISAMLSSSLLLSTVSVYAQGNHQVAIGGSNTEPDIEHLISLLGEDSDELVIVNGNDLNEYLNDGSNESTGVFSSVSVEFLEQDSGVEVEIVTPENITEVSATTYRNVAIAAGAKNVLIQVAAAKPVTGHGALAGVYKIFDDEGMELAADDIENAEKLVDIEQLLSDETNMKDSEISKFIAEFHLAIIEKIDEKEELEKSDISDILDANISKYNYVFTDELMTNLTEYGIAFSKSDNARNPETKSSFEKTLENIEEIAKTYKHGNVEVTFNDIYFTDERDMYSDKDFDNVLVLDYEVENKGDQMSIPSDQLFKLYVDDNSAESYILPNYTFDDVSPGRKGKGIVGFAFNGNYEKLELELKDYNTFNEKPTIIEVPKSLKIK